MLTKYKIEMVQTLELKRLKLNIVDGHILSYLKKLSSRKNLKTIEIDGEVYFWFCYRALLDFIPILGFDTSRSLSLRVSKYCDAGLMKKHVVKSSTCGTLVYVYLTKNLDKICEDVVPS